MEHRRAQRAIDAYVAAVAEERRLGSAVAVWERIASSQLPVLVRDAIAPMVEDARAEHAAAVQFAKDGEAAVEMSHWYKLWTEIAQLPLFRDQHAVSVGQALTGALKLAYTIEPEWTKKVSKLVRTGGLPALRRKLGEFVTDASSKSANDSAPPDYRTLNASDWRALLNQFPTKVALADHLGIDLKTLAARLKQHRVKKAPVRSPGRAGQPAKRAGNRRPGA